MALILRRNEAERKKHGVNLILQYFIPIRHARYQRVYQLLNLKPTQASHPIPFFFFVFLHLFSFLSAIKNSCFYRFGPKASNSMYSFSCTYLPEAPLAWACKALSTASFLDWISTSFSHDQKRNIDFKFFFVSLNLFWFLFFSKCR